MDTGKLTKISIFTALVFVATTIIRVTIPATGGYFNFGDSVIFAAAILYGPLVGGLSGGIGAAIADAIGYPIFAPGTLIIKLCEGAITGYVGTRIRPNPQAVTFWRALSILLGLGLGAATYYIGYNYMAAFGNALLDQITWAAVAMFLGVFIIFVGFKPQTETSWQTTAIILGGLGMVIGYFLYENLLAVLFPGLGIFAIGEIPANIGQMLVGLTIALPVVKVAKKAFPSGQSAEGSRLQQ
jgi:uncharacterized membrane protein